MPLKEPNTLPSPHASETGAPEELLTPREVFAVPDEPGGFERRRDVRYPTSDPAEVEIFPPAVVREGALILDVSRSGLRVHLKTEAPKGTHVRIRLLKTHLTIFGEVRYCRPVGDGFDVGVWIEHMFNASEEVGKHIADIDLCFYIAGKGLAVEEVILLKDHLITCEICQARLAKKESELHPAPSEAKLRNKRHASGKAL